MKPKVSDKLKLLDESPGVYIMKDQNDEIIYVGKAKKLIKRVTQYFTRPQEGKTAKMVANVEDFDFFVTHSDKEAFLLEMNLIHKYLPRYNIRLKDGSSYPYIKIQKEQDPIVSIARNCKNKKASYFGPYPNSSSAYEMVTLLQRVFPLQECSRPNRPCLYCEMGQCLGPRSEPGYQDKLEKVLKRVRIFMNGDVAEVKKDLTARMQKYSDSLQFENALECKKTLESIDYVVKKQNIIYKQNINRDVFSFHIMGDYIAFATLVIRNGLLINCITNVIPLVGSNDEALIEYIMEFYEKYPKPHDLIVPDFEDASLLSEVIECKVIIAKSGANLKLVQMGAANAIRAMESELAIQEASGDVLEALDKLKQRLKIESTHNIELIDNSHLHGEANVSAVVVFTNGLPNKKLYRKYQVSDEHRGNDYGAMYEVIYRRYYRKLSENQGYSDLLLVDGGLQQVHAAEAALKELMIQVPVFGLVKNDKHQTRAIVDTNGNEIEISDDNTLFFMLTRMQDEVHRFVITYHRNQRNKSLTSSILDEIPGLGKKRQAVLLTNFGTISKIKEASLEELRQYVPLNVAKTLKDKL